jgi:hypothetical protein
MPSDSGVDEDQGLDQNHTCLLIKSEKPEPNAAFSPNTTASSLINVPSRSELVIFTDASGSDSEAEVRCLTSVDTLNVLRFCEGLVRSSSLLAHV